MTWWLLLWWVVNPGHFQKIHLEHYNSLADCEQAAAYHRADAKGDIRYHCTEE